MLNRIFHSQTKSISQATLILAISFLISGFLGILTDRLLAGRFGAGLETSVYFASFKIPDFVYNILISGGVLVAFLPIFTEYFSEKKEKAWEMSNYIINVFSFLLVLISFLLFLLTPWLIEFITPGFSPAGKAMTVALTRILLLQPIFLGISNIFSGILQHFDRFLAYSLAPIFYNLGIIFGILFLSPRFGIFGVGFGVILGAALHLAIQIPSSLHSGFKYEFRFDFKYPAVKKVFFLMLSRIFALSAGQINIIVTTAIASTIAAGSIAIFNFSNAIQGFPATILGISLATAVFPAFSKLWVAGQKKEFLEKFSLVFRQALFFIIPLSILAFAMRAQLVRLILGTGKFNWDDTRLTAASLGLFSLSIFASTMIPFLTRIFFSFQDAKRPTIISVVSVAINIGLSLLFVQLLDSSNAFSDFLARALKLEGIENKAVISLPLAFSISAICQFVLLLFFLRNKVGDFGTRQIAIAFKKIMIAAVPMTVAAYLVLRSAAVLVDTKTFLGLLAQSAAASGISILVYIVIINYLGSPELKTAFSLIFSRFKK